MAAHMTEKEYEEYQKKVAKTKSESQNIKTNYKTPDQSSGDQEILARQNARVEHNRAIRDKASHVESTVEKIKRVAASTAKTAGETIRKVSNNPNVQKAGRIAKDRVDVFNQNITRDVAPTRQRPAQQYQPKHQPKHSAPRPQHHQSAQDNPFNLGGSTGMSIGGAGSTGSGNPFGIGGKKKTGANDNPFGIGR